MGIALPIDGLAHCAVFVKTLQSAVAFYCDILGFERVYLYQEHTLFVKKGTMVFELIEDGMDHTKENEGEQRHLAMACKDIETVYEQVKAQGVLIEEPGLVHLPDFGDNGCAYFLFRGPEGERLELQEIF